MKPGWIAVTAALLASVNFARADVAVVVGGPATVVVSEPFSIDFEKDGTLYGVEFTKSNRVFKLAEGKLEFIAGVAQNTEKNNKPQVLADVSDPKAAKFNGMHDLQVAADHQLIIADSFDNAVRRMNLATGAVTTLADGFNIAMTSTLSIDGKHLYVADIGNHRVKEIALADGKVTTVAGNGQKGNPADGADALQTPMGDARAVTQAADGSLYVILRGGNSLVQVRNGKVKTVVNASGKKGYGGDGGDARDALMNGPKYVAMDRDGNVLICDTENHCVRRFSPKTGVIELIAGSPGKPGTGLGESFLKTELRRPHGLRLAPDGKLYICDTYNNRVLSGSYH